jgi:hypothetical protein
MYQSSTRKNFLDILADPTALAILASIVLHGTIAATLPFFTQLEKEDKKAGPTTVKVVELTPSELQRIPQAPPIPTPQVLPPTKTIAPSRPSAATPRTTQFSTAPQTIPFSPLRPSDGTIFKPPAVTKPKAAPKKQTVDPIFDPNIFKDPVTKPTTPAKKTGVTPKPSPLVKKVKPSASPTPQQNTRTDDDGGDRAPTQTSPPPNRQAQQPPAGTSKPSAPINKPTTPTDRPSGNPGGDSGSGLYGRYIQDALKRVQQYQTKYPDIKLYAPKTLSQPYPPGIACTKAKQPAFIVLMVAFDKVPPGQDTNILGDNTSPLLGDERPYFKGDTSILANKKLLEIATTAGFADATEADKKRPPADRGKPVLYQYRVQFDPASCKN